jgi:hypothetical protein
MAGNLWSDEEVEFIKKLREEHPDYTNNQLSDLMKCKGYNRSSESIRHFFRGNIKKSKVIFEQNSREKFENGFDPEQYLQELCKIQDEKFNVFRKHDNIFQKISKININTDKPIAISFISDVHLGNPFCDVARLKKTLDAIHNEENMYIALGGDTIDNFIIQKLISQTDKTDIAVYKQWMLFKYILEEYQDSFLYVGLGNHEEFTKKMALISAQDIFVDKNKFIYTGSNGTYVFVTVGNEEYRISINHKLKYNSVLNRHHAHKRKYDLASIGDLDIITMEHLHEGGLETFWRHGKKRLALSCGTFKLFDEFGESLGYDHANNIIPTVILYPDSHRMVALEYYEDAIIYLKGLEHSVEK